MKRTSEERQGDAGQVRSGEIFTYKSKHFAQMSGECVDSDITKVELCGMTLPFAVARVSPPRGSSLRNVKRHNLYL